MEDDKKGQKEVSKQSIKEELIQMGFPIDRIDKALEIFKTKVEAVDYLIAYGEKAQQEEKMPEENQDDFQDQEEDFKMIFVVRMDLKLALGQIAELVATAALKAYKQIESQIEIDENKEFAFFEWTEGGQRKIVVKANSEKELLEVAEKAKASNINFVLIQEQPSNLKFEKPPPVSAPKKKKREIKSETKVEEEKDRKSMENEGKKDSQMNSQAKIQAVSSAKEEPTDKMQQQKSKEEKELQKEVFILGAFGPAAESDIDPFTKHFKLL